MAQHQQQQQLRERFRDSNLSIYGESSRSTGVSLSDCYDYRSINYLTKLPVIINDHNSPQHRI